MKARKMSNYGMLLGALSLAPFAFADLLGVAPGNPLISYDAGGTTVYTSVDGKVVIDATPLSFTNSAGITGDIFPITGPADFDINFELDPLCGQATGNPAGDDLVITGDVDFNFDFVPEHSGTLLTAELIATGFAAPNGSVDTFDARFVVTAGALVTAGEYAVGDEVGLILTVENSGFAGDCTVDWAGSAKGTVGLIDSTPPGPAPGTGTLGYWKTHPEAWPVTSVTVGGVTYTQVEALDILQTPSRGDKSLSMAKQLIPAILNVAAGNDSSCIDSFIDAGNQWLIDNGGVASGQRQWGVDGDLIHDELDAYNNGLLCAPHRD